MSRSTVDVTVGVFWSGGTEPWTPRAEAPSSTAISVERVPLTGVTRSTFSGALPALTSLIADTGCVSAPAGAAEVRNARATTSRFMRGTVRQGLDALTPRCFRWRFDG